MASTDALKYTKLMLVHFIIFVYLIAFVGSIIVYIQKMQRWRIA
jgi:hypothetical protein